MNQKRVLVLQHTEAEHLGIIVEALAEKAVDYTYIRADLRQSVPETVEPYHGLVIMGGYQGVYEEQQYPYLRIEKALIHQAVHSGKPVLGICLGSQLLADVLGSRVYASGYFEVGWKKVYLSADMSSDPVLGHLPRVIEPIHWHGDVYGVPPEAVSVGASDLTPVQGFVWRGRCYGLLFHLEMTIEQLTQMATKFPQDIARAGTTVNALLDQAAGRFARMRELAMTTFRKWASTI